MPGTILVSVLEFMELPLSSSTCMIVSMGKIEYQINGKGKFSFPLTSLRDDLIVKIQDVDGNEISSTGVHIRLILEKGVWEDMFPLGDGHLHLKLQFILNDEERERIRIMRQSALKKKQELLPSSSQRSEEGGSTTIIDNAALPLRTIDEVSDQNKSTKPVSQEVNLNQLQHKGKIPANQSQSEKHPQRVTVSEEISSDECSLRITPSNVRKMISAFESGQGQDMRSYIKPPPTKYQWSKIEMKDSSKTQLLEQDKSWSIEPEGFLQERVKSNSLVRDLMELSTLNTMKKQKDSNGRSNLKVAHKKDIEEQRYNKDLMTTSTFETVLVSGKKPEKRKEENICGYASEGTPHESCFQKDSPRKMDSVVHFNKFYSFESSGVWIFPDEPRKICITTRGKSVMGLVEIQHTKDLSHQRSLEFSKLENEEKNAADDRSGTEGSKYEKKQENEKSKTKSSNNNGDENSGGPINKVLKVTIIIGFGILVLLTRQRKRR